MPACASIKFDNATPTNAMDWSGIDFSKVAANSVIDLQGRTLLVDDAVSSNLTITDTSSGDPGTLRWAVESGTCLNDKTTLSGNLKFRKEGEGTFVAAKTGLTYTGGTDVAEGTVRVGSSGTGHFGTGPVVVPSGTTYDVYGNDSSSVNLILAGGTLQNSATSGATLPKFLTLTADSHVVHANASSDKNDMTVPNQCDWNLGGKTLSEWTECRLERHNLRSR